MGLPNFGGWGSPIPFAPHGRLSWSDIMVISVYSVRMTVDSSQARTIPAGEFKAKCLKLMDEVNETGVPIIITKRGRPVSRLVPADQPNAGIRGLFPELEGLWDDPSETVVDLADVDSMVAGLDPA